MKSTEFFLSLFHWHVGPHFARTYHWKQLEYAISKQMKLAIINFNKWDSFKNKYNLPSHQKASLKETGKEWTLWIINVHYVSSCNTSLDIIKTNIIFLNESRMI